MKNKKQVAKALGRIPSGLFIVTAKYKDKEEYELEFKNFHWDNNVISKLNFNEVNHIPLSYIRNLKKLNIF